jgi:dipeptidyl aminopeptidase/acylaminoacyl peptidase
VNALAQEVKLPARLDRWTDPDLDLNRVTNILPTDDGLVVGVHGSEGVRLHRVDPAGRDLVLLEDIGPVYGVWTGDGRDVLASSEGALWRVSPSGKRWRLLDLPDGAAEVAATWHNGGPVVACLVDRTPERDSEAPRISPTPRSVLTLVRHTPATGWTDLAEAPAGVRQLTISRDGSRLVWIEYVNVVPEEARRAEVRSFDVDTGKLCYMTRNAGKLDAAEVAPDGSSVIYAANHQTRRPVTTHTDVWWVRWDGSGRRNLTGGGRCIEACGWGRDAGEVWITEVDGLTVRSSLLQVNGQQAVNLDLPATSAAPVWMADGGCAFEGEDAGAFPMIYIGRRRVKLPQPAPYRDLQTRPVKWRASDGQEVQGVVYESVRTPAGAPLLVRVHGGPAGEVAALRSQVVRHRHLIKAGYRVFNPAFRGSLGFGDDFLAANIGCQGEADLDDIVSGIDHLARSGLADVDRVGIFGGSYGGYMTLRALAVSDRFRAGVASYGFIHNRWMTLETGDFTYETEYVGPLRWPPTARAQKGNVFPHLGSVKAPLLLLHGDSDTICPPSQSLVAYRSLEARGVPTGLVVYPGEGHGFRKKANQRDSARRTLAWFLEYLSP